MNFLHKSLIYPPILLVILSSFLACGGGSSSGPSVTPPPPPPAKSTFSLTLRQRTSCDAGALLPGAIVLVYDQSPLTNYNTPFTAYTTDATGNLSLELPLNSKISFSILLETAQLDKKVYTFNELDADAYDLTVLYYDESPLEANCTCQTLAFNADLLTNASIADLTETNLYWGKGRVPATVSYSNQINFSNVTLCGNSHESTPVAVKTKTLAGQEFYGFKSVADSQDLSLPIPIEFDATYLVKPDRGEAYSVEQNKLIGNSRYFNQFTPPDATQYATYPAFNADLNDYRISSLANASATGIQTSTFFLMTANRVVKQLLTNDDISVMPAVPQASFVDLEVDDVNRTIRLVTDNTDSDWHFNSTLLRSVLPNGRLFRWSVYSPNRDLVIFPLLEESYEVDYLQSQLQLLLTTMRKIDTATDYNSAVTISRFNDLVSGVNNPNHADRRLVWLYVDIFGQKNGKPLSKRENNSNPNAWLDKSELMELR